MFKPLRKLETMLKICEYPITFAKKQLKIKNNIIKKKPVLLRYYFFIKELLRY
ncbi:hypothetical protein Y10_29600 [Neptunitalea sp. Y10]|uniref:Uncharacterized protein n=1 Tax=Neptunitalea lumnitzerae TaxID=2965509 RepID=A0ABQ5MNM5_9FLAO|nr:hypothetical protein Y10_29600 [Neptunitalea sp. Y10]